jgi:hypothetical protein
MALLQLVVMRSRSQVAAIAAILIAALGMPVLAHRAAAEGAKPSDPAPCTCPNPDNAPSHWQRPKLADQKIKLDEDDEIAALEAVRLALSEVGDGSTYVWHRRNGRLSGMVQPTASFKNIGGNVCRHIVLIMTSGTQSGRVEGIACRLSNGRWQLDG